MWKKLAQLQAEMLWRGSLFAFSATYPFEEKVVLMLCDHQMGEEPFDFVTITGAKAGINPYVILPKQCLFDGNTHAVSTEWLKENWTKWVWPDGNIDEVWFRPPLSVADIFDKQNQL
jgi:hypothetical protein